MCIAPITLRDGTQTACHECWQCRERKIDDWVGRCVAESKTAGKAYAVTLTYGRGSLGEVLHERAVILTYSDVQKYLKLLRRHGYPVRYFVTGEKGSLKGRCHWHIVLFFEKDAPAICGYNEQGKWVENAKDRNVRHCRLDENGQPIFDDEGTPAMWWPHGFSFWQELNHAAVRYNCKYIQKDVLDPDAEISLPRMSKKPPLGFEYFDKMAARYVEQGLAPQTLEYRFADVRRRDGKLAVFLLRDRSAELFLDNYVRRWHEVHPAKPLPNSELVRNWVEWRATRVPEDAARYGEFVERRAHALPAFVPNTAKPCAAEGNTYSWMPDRSIRWNVDAIAWEAPGPPGSEEKWRWVFDVKRNGYRWQKVRVNPGRRESRRAAR